MTIKIKEIYGYKLGYQEGLERFVLEDTDGTELAYGKTQSEVEVKAKSLRQQEFKRIRIIKVQTEGVSNLGELTSLNRDDNSAWVSMEKGEDSWGSGRSKIALHYDHGFYEATETNLKILENIKGRRETLLQIKSDIDTLIGTLEKPINLAYFGITR